ncbi:hypothetical protein [Cupriavidus pauculus]|uniref:Uncharacterized protein n=1 Tax=Cupriavidus pauculus TaxID=82633 RepID=A0A3G8H3F9_9BURK|nr:hypothetical protein [Cupriavidus pauculus]AZG14978.1 hypothetical protein EHF44_16985 [Cupriavidus pauculus]
MNLTRLTFDFDGHKVEVTGYHYAGYSGDVSPPEPESFSIHQAAIIKQADADDPVSVDDLDEDELADAALRAWRDREDDARSDLAYAFGEDRWMESRGYL